MSGGLSLRRDAQRRFNSQVTMSSADLRALNLAHQTLRNDRRNGVQRHDARRRFYNVTVVMTRSSRRQKYDSGPSNTEPDGKSDAEQRDTLALCLNWQLE